MHPFYKRLIQHSRHFVLYGCLMAVLVFVLKWLQWKFLITDNAFDIYAGLLALFFTLLGVWFANQLANRKVKTVVIEKEIYVPLAGEFIVNEAALAKLKLTNRKYEVLKLLAQGHSNTEIAERLFLSVSTVKTHVSNVFVKMDVKSRAQAIEKSKRLKITP